MNKFDVSKKQQTEENLKKIVVREQILIVSGNEW